MTAFKLGFSGYVSIFKFKIQKIFLLLVVSILFQIVSFGIIYTSNRLSPASLLAAAEKVDLKESADSGIKISSKYGYSLKVDTSTLTSLGFVFRSDGKTFDQYENKDLSETRDYALIEIYPKTSKAEYFHMMVSTSIRKNFFTEKKLLLGKDLNDLEVTIKNFEPKPTGDLSYSLVKRENVTLGAKEYTKLQYKEIKNDKSLSSIIKDKFETKYVTIQNNRPYVFTLRYQDQNSVFTKAGENIISNTQYSKPDTDALFISEGQEDVDLGLDFQKNNKQVAYNSFLSRRVLGTSTKGGNSDTIKVVATNLPAVVRIVSIYCATVGLVNPNSVFDIDLKPACAGGFGTGFFVSANGYIGTNGHVVKLNSRDIIATAIRSRDEDTIAKLLAFAYAAEHGKAISKGELERLLDNVLGSEDILAQLENVVYLFPDDLFAVKAEKSSFGIQLGKTPISLEFDGTPAGSKIEFSDSILEAKFVAADYDFNDLLNLSENPQAGFKKSDVAILKVEGNKFPFVKLGSIEGLTSGDEITVIGYPGLSEENGLVSTEESKATATKGIVSSIRESKGNKKKLIQSDVSIDHGNSGGPALNQDGEVVGLATYGIPGESGTFNFMRDIADLKVLLAKNNVKLTVSGETQKNWETGLNKFLKSYYKASIKNFEEVLSIYPDHVLAEDYIATAKDKISKGEDKSGIVEMIGIGMMVLGTLGIVIAIAVWVFRKKKNRIEKLSPPAPPNYQVPIPAPPRFYPTT